MSAKKLLLLSGPNLDQLGTREPELYGAATLDDHVGLARSTAEGLGFELDHFQSASESDLISKIHEARSQAAGLIINAGAFTHYSWAIHDALLMFQGPKVELHITNTGAREEWRHKSVIAPAVTGTVAGFGLDGYRLAVLAAIGKLSA